MLLNAMGDAEGAESAFVAAAEAAPRRADIWSTYSVFAMGTEREGRFKQAASRAFDALTEAGETIPAALEIAVRAWRGRVCDLSVLAETLYQTVRQNVGKTGRRSLVNEVGWAAEALRSLLNDTLPQEEPEALRAAYALGLTYAALEAHALAVPLYAAAYQGLDKGDLKVRAAMAWSESLASLGKADQAVLVLEAASVADPANMALRLALARRLAAAGRGAEARDRYEELLRASVLSEEQREALRKEMDLAGQALGTG
jgi:tetratricopeptide (TPR) repeat protein